MFETLLQSIVVYSLVTYAAMLTFRYSSYPDLSVDGVFTTGMVTFVVIYNYYNSIILALFTVILVSGIIGFLNSKLSKYLYVHPILISVIILIMLYTVNLRILGTPNLALSTPVIDNFLYSIIISSLLIILISIFFKSELGTLMKTVGQSFTLIYTLARNPYKYQHILISLASIFVGIAGALTSMRNGFADVTSGFGVVVTGITALIIGEKLSNGKHDFSTVVSGTTVYFLVERIALMLNFHPEDVKLATGLLVLFLLISNNKTNNAFIRNQ